MTNLAQLQWCPFPAGAAGTLQLSHPEGNLQEVSLVPSPGGCPSSTPTGSPRVPTEPASPDPGMPGLFGFASLLQGNRTSVWL